MEASRLRSSFETERFVLKSLNIWQALQVTGSWRKDPQVLRALFPFREPKTLFDWYLRGPIPRSPRRFVYSITPKGETQPIGANTVKLFGHRSAFGVVAIHDRSWWGKDVVVEVRAELMNQFFRHTTVERFYGQVEASNVASIFCYRKLGFSHVDTWRAKQTDPVTGEAIDFVNFEIFRDEWLAGRFWRDENAG